MQWFSSLEMDTATLVQTLDECLHFILVGYMHAYIILIVEIYIYLSMSVRVKKGIKRVVERKKKPLNKDRETAADDKTVTQKKVITKRKRNGSKNKNK